MAEFVTGVAALALLFVIGEFYYRLGGWLFRTLAQAWRTVSAADRHANPHQPVTELATLPDDSRYLAALAMASAVVDELATRPDLSPPDKLSTVTFTLLHAMRAGESSGTDGMVTARDGFLQMGMARRYER